MKIIVMSFYSAITRFRLLNRRGFAASSLRLMPTLMIILDNDISGGAAVFVKTPGAPAIPLLLNTWLFIILGFNRLFRQYHIYTTITHCSLTHFIHINTIHFLHISDTFNNV